MNRHGEKFKIITNSCFKRILKQVQERMTKTNEDQIKAEKNKPKLKAKQPVKAMKQKKKFCLKNKEMLSTKMELPCLELPCLNRLYWL